MFINIASAIIFSVVMVIVGVQGLRVIIEDGEFMLGTMFLVCAALLLLSIMKILFAS